MLPEYNQSYRRGFLKAGAAAITASLAGKPREGYAQQLMEDVPVKYAGTSVYYGEANPQVQRSIGDYDSLVLEPGHFAKAPKHGIAYIPLSGLNKDNPKHFQLFKEIMKVTGFLTDANGQYVEDPNGPGTYMIDWRKPEVGKVMSSYIKNLMSRGFDGVMFDAIDSVAVIENKDPNHFGATDKSKGLTQSAMIFAFNAKNFIKQQKNDGEVIINGGIFTPYNGNDQGFDLKKAVGMTADKIMVESQYSVNGTPRNNENDKNWLVAQLVDVVSASKISEFGIAVVDPGWQPAQSPSQAKQIAKDAMSFTKNVLEEVQSQANKVRGDKPIKLHGSIICTNDYQSPEACVGNAQLANEVNKSRGR